MVRELKIDDYELGSDKDGQSYVKARAIIEGLEKVITTVHPESKNISYTGLLGVEWAQRTFGAVYELPKGVAYLNFAHISHYNQARLSGKILLIGEEGFSKQKGTLTESILKYLKEKEIKVSERGISPASLD